MARKGGEMKLLDLFCGAGGCSMGYHRAGFDVVGVDIAPQKHYPFEFHQADAFEYLRDHGHEFDAIHASPPCQRYSICTPKKHRADHPDLLNSTIGALFITGKPFVVENVAAARTQKGGWFMLCGTMFGLNIWRHRYFWVGHWDSPFFGFPLCHHNGTPISISGTHKKKTGFYEDSADACRIASGIDWMTRKELDQAIPPAYTEFIGKQLMKALK
jgi:DNA (cytosine-5)-methyltransferase 1